MNTFLPYADFRKSAKVLDMKRLGKQRVEVLQLLNAIVNKAGWRNHPAAKMWEKNLPSLCDYGIAICDEWLSRGYRDTCRDKIIAYRSPLVEPLRVPYNPPSWLGDVAFHRSHQSNLVRKMPEHYRKYFPNIPDNLPYIWP